MKSKNYLLFVVASIILVFMSCKSKKIASGFEDVSCPIERVMDNETHYRAYASGESPKMELSRDISMHNAKARLASNLESNLSGLTDKFVEQFDINDKQIVKELFQSTSKDFFKQKIGRVNTIKEKTLRNKENQRYVTWVSIEISRDEYLDNFKNNLQNRINKDEELKLLFDKHNFDEKYNKAKEEYEKERNK